MGLIIKEHTVTGTRGSDTVRVVYDGGLPDSFVRGDIAEILGAPAPSIRPIHFVMADRQEEVTAETCISLNLQVDGILIWHWFYVVDGLPEELIAGADMIRKWKISLNPDNETVTVDPRAEDLNRRTGIIIPIPVAGE